MDKANYQITYVIKHKAVLAIIVLFLQIDTTFAQSGIPVIKASDEKASIKDGDNFKMDWKLEPTVKPDVYYVNIPAKKSMVEFITDKETLTFRTKPGKTYQLMVLLNEKDTCHIEISSKLPPNLPKIDTPEPAAVSFPFELKGSKIFFNGSINKKDVVIEFDLGAGTSVVNRNSSERLGLSFSSHTIVNNTSGVNKERTSLDNRLDIGEIGWNDVPLTEVGNMKPLEDIIIGNGFFRSQIIEINYDTQKFIVHSTLPSKIKGYTKLPVFYEQNRPKFKAVFTQNGRKYDFWFLFDTGRDGTMLLGEDFTAQHNNWNELYPLNIINDRKIVRVDATIAGVHFKDIVTNAANPAKPNGRSSLFGNQILNHFNVILDNINGFIYLKPNSRTTEPYFDYNSYLKEISENKGNNK